MEDGEKEIGKKKGELEIEDGKKRMRINGIKKRKTG